MNSYTQNYIGVVKNIVFIADTDDPLSLRNQIIT